MIKNSSNTLSPKVLEFIVCPVTGCRLEYNKEQNMLISAKAGLGFPIRSGVPIMIQNEALSIIKK